MSVLTTMALMVTALKAAVHREQQAHMKTRAALWPELDGSAEELAKAKARVAELEDDVARANVQYRRDQELIDLWRERALGTPAMRAAAWLPAGPDFRPPQIAQQQAMQAALAQAQQAQYNPQPATNAQNYGALYQNQMLGQAAVGLLGAQNLIDAELWCNCVPARHDMFLRGR